VNTDQTRDESRALGLSHTNTAQPLRITLLDDEFNLNNFVLGKSSFSNTVYTFSCGKNRDALLHGFVVFQF